MTQWVIQTSRISVHSDSEFDASTARKRKKLEICVEANANVGAIDTPVDSEVNLSESSESSSDECSPNRDVSGSHEVRVIWNDCSGPEPALEVPKSTIKKQVKEWSRLGGVSAVPFAPFLQQVKEENHEGSNIGAGDTATVLSLSLRLNCFQT
ncbi:unnamed protein product [Acanthoscelides obtectus]|uniref:Uncharacterized protein n=1 Tax=Acanthoscelides obtectus TaxID=200917 RepID=A0A9P0P4E7_ACAOB|nr:unnamed protein product [Acanthoscelides obtectus]CAK1622587.1 hypothetical protein AOBTE_LOCUS1576 [Acanthoscelides obtectus]